MVDFKLLEYKEFINEGRIKPFINYINDIKGVKNTLKRKNDYWVKKNTWSSWQKIHTFQIMDYHFDFGIKIILDNNPHPFVIQSKEFGDYMISNINPEEHENIFDKKGNLIKQRSHSIRGSWTKKSLQRELSTLNLLDYTDSEAIDMLIDFINIHPGTQEYVVKKFHINDDEFDVADFLYTYAQI